MDLSINLSAYIILTILFFLLLRLYGIRIWSAFILAIFTGSLILYGICDIDCLHNSDEALLTFYIINGFIVTILVIVYIYTSGFNDREFISA